ncbi:hypothetical protein [Granulicatella adiacens]|uniref:hypothetical protein n=1 Tax=Granulicatella adiacens TaxID=46124 RepID=UPI001C3D0F60|nr:hypothetical protein [Granulicatella adiacens]
MGTLTLHNVRANELIVNYFKRGNISSKKNLDFSDYQIVYSLNGQLVTFSCFQSYAHYGYPEYPFIDHNEIELETIFGSENLEYKNVLSRDFKAFVLYSDSHDFIKSFLLKELISLDNKTFTTENIPSQIFDVHFLETDIKLSVMNIKEEDVFELVAII